MDTHAVSEDLLQCTILHQLRNPSLPIFTFPSPLSCRDTTAPWDMTTSSCFQVVIQ